MSWYYQIYGLSVVSDLELDELPYVKPCGKTSIDLTINSGRADEGFLQSLSPIHPQIRIGPRGLWLDIFNVAQYAVVDGSKIFFECYKGADPSAVKLYLLGSCIGTVLWQRGFTVLHGNAIKIGNDLVACVGHSGAGKSTLAAEFARRGYSVIADDVVAVDQNMHVIQGIPRIKLWQESLDHFQLDSRILHRVRAGENKYCVKFASNLEVKPGPIDWLFVLEPHDCDYPQLEASTVLKGLSFLLEHSYRRELLSGLGLQSGHFHNCVKIASRLKIVRARRPKVGFLLHELCDEILRLVESSH